MIELVIDETPTSGYVWRGHSEDPSIAVVESTFEHSAKPIGGSGQRVLRVRVDGAGTHVLELRLGRAWKPEPLERRFVKLIAR